MRFVILSLLLALNCLGQDFNGLGDLAAGGVPVATGGGAITLDAITNWVHIGNAVQTITLPTSGSSRYMVLVVATQSGTSVSATYNGVALSLVTSRTNSDVAQVPDFYLWIYGLVAPASGSHDLVATLTGPPSSWCFSLSDWTGVNQSTPYSGTQTNQGINAASPTTLTISSVTGEVVVDAAVVYGSDITAGGSQTEIANETESPIRLGLAKSSGAASVTPTWTYSGNRWWNAAALSLKQ